MATSSNGTDRIFPVLYSTDEDLLKNPDVRGEVTSLLAYNENGIPAKGGIKDPEIFGKKKGARCRCGAVVEEGVVCPMCLTPAKAEQTKTSMGYIRLPIKYLGPSKPFLAAILGVTQRKLENCWLGHEKYGKIFAGNREILGASALADYIESLDGSAFDGVIAKLKAECQEGAKRLSKGIVTKDHTFGEDEGALESKETVLMALEGARNAGLLPKDLMRGIVLCLPDEFRPVSEIGTDPEGVVNKAYMKILAASESVRRLPANASETVRRRVENNYAAAIKEAVADLDVLDTKKGLGQKSLSARLKNGFRGVVEGNTRYNLDEIGVPYDVLLRLYKNEMMEALKQDVEDVFRKTEKSLFSGSLSAEDEKRIRTDLTAKIMADYDYEIRRFQRAPGQTNTESYIYRKLEMLLENKYILADRFPNTSKQNYVGVKPRISRIPDTLFVNPALCNDGTLLDFDGDTLTLVKGRTEEFDRAVEESASPGMVPNSMITGEPLYLPDREYAWGNWLATKMYSPEESNFLADVVIDAIDIGEEKKVGTCERGGGFLYARRIIARPEDDSVALGKCEVGTVIKTKDGPFVVPQTCQCIEHNGEKLLVCLSTDSIEIPPFAKILVKKGDIVPEGKNVLEWEVPEFNNLQEALAVMKKLGDIDANNKIRIPGLDGGKDVETCAGRIQLWDIICRHMNPDQRIDVPFWPYMQASKFFVQELMKDVCEDLDKAGVSREEISRRYIETAMELQRMGREYATQNGGYSQYDTLSYPDVRTPDMPCMEDKDRFNSARDITESGAKGSKKNNSWQVINLNGWNPIEDAPRRAEQAGNSKKGGFGEPGEMTPVQASGAINRILQEALGPYVINSEDCGTDVSLAVSLKGLTKPAAMERGKLALEGRTLAEDYLIKSENRIIPKNTLITRKKDIEAITNDAFVEGRTIKVRTLNGCRCSGGCAKCFGADPSTGREIEVGSAIGLLADQALTKLLSEKVVLKKADNKDKGQISVVQEVTDILNGRESIWKAAVAGGPKKAVLQMERELSSAYRRAANLTIAQPYLEVIARGLVNVQVIDDKGQSTYYSFGDWMKLFGDGKNDTPREEIARIRNPRLAARGILGKPMVYNTIATGGGGDELRGLRYDTHILGIGLSELGKKKLAEKAEKEKENG